MRSKDITLSASLIAIYIAIQVAGSVSPISGSALMGCALFGMFWPYFSLKRNLTFQALRVGWVLISMVRTAPQMINYMKMQSIKGLMFIDWFTFKFGGIVDTKSREMLVILSQIKMGLNFWLFMTGFLILFYSVVPYIFFRYFKAIGLFKRMPSF